MTWLIVGAIIAYLAVGAGLARLWAWMNDYQSASYYVDGLHAEMVGVFFLWPFLVPLWLVVQAVCWAIFPRRMR
jgi:hypothetical protein